MSVMEMSFRSKTLLVLVAGGTRLAGFVFRFRLLPCAVFAGWGDVSFGILLNLTLVNELLDFVDTGAWSKKAIKEAGSIATSTWRPPAVSPITITYRPLPIGGSVITRSSWHVCSNETDCVCLKEFSNTRR